MECPHWLQLAQGEARGFCTLCISMHWNMRPATGHSSRREAWPPWLFNYIFVSEAIVPKTLTWNLIPLNSFPGQNGAGVSYLYGSQGVLGTFQICREEIKSPVSEELGLRKKFEAWDLKQNLPKWIISGKDFHIQVQAGANESTTLGFFSNWQTYCVMWLLKVLISLDSWMWFKTGQARIGPSC